MRIQHNIMALNAYRQLGGNNSALAKNLEKLSSGYAINRAGDDAAGLAISEKMRAQIKGLEAAQKNANDGISLVQTAEGALTEVHSMLNRMVYMATQSANGTYDNEVDRASLDEELQTLKEEIDRISKATNFNGLKLLDGSMDADATRTTGGTTNVPILQEVATNPTLEVGSKTVLHKDADEVARTEINIELHNITSTSKTKAGDSIKFTIGDAEVELNVVESKVNADGSISAADGTTPNAYDLLAGETYTAEKLALMIQDKFNAGDRLIGGQKFTATADGKGVKFLQDAEPNDRTEVVNADVDVKVEYVNNPSGNPVDYTMNIKEDALKEGSSITIGGEKLTFGEANSIFENVKSLTDIANANPPIETSKGYKLSYANGVLTITDPNGKLGAPTVKYDGYEVAQKATATETKGADIANNTEGKTLALAIPTGGYIANDKIEIKVPKADGTGTDTITFTRDNGGAWTSDAAAGTDLVKYTLTENTTTHALTLNTAIAGADGNKTIAAADITFKPGNPVVSATDLDMGAVTDADGDGNISDAEQQLTDAFSLVLDPVEDDKIEWNGNAWTFDGTAWVADASNGNYELVPDAADAKSFKIKTTASAAAGGVTGQKWQVTYADRTATADVKFDAGKDGTKASTTFDLSGANLKDGDKIVLTNGNGETKEFIYKTDLATTFGDLDELGTFVSGQPGLTPANTAGAVDEKGVAVTDAEAYTVTIANGKITVTSNMAGEAGTNVGSHATTLKVETSKKEETTGEVKTAANADTITGTWNVQSTKSVQGASPDSGQLASTTFDFTADMAQDGNSLTIGKETYVFKVGKDSTVKAGAGETIVDLSNVEADDPDFVNKAMTALKNAALNNAAFTVGGAKDSGKISIHEKEGQTVFTDGELNSVEEFDKLVYMNSPEVTENTGKGLTFQVGDTADDYQKVALSIHDMSSAGLGIADVSIATIDDAAAAIDKIKAAINTVSSQRGDLGAIQNRLEHTINNLGVQTENITAAESRIRDTDMAQEMMAYTKNNILVQAAQAMLAQANQVPQGILQLLQ